MIYLNEDFEGGETSFGPYSPSAGHCAANGLTIKSQTGMALFFEHLKLHKGESVTKGRKYVLRTDVIYRVASDEYKPAEIPFVGLGPRQPQVE